MSAPLSESNDSCPNCGQAAMDAYCSQCGEKRRDRADWKLSSIASEIFGEITNVEHSKLWQTLRLLVLVPGQLTREHWVGRRKPYLGPVKLYLIFFAVSLVLYSIHQPTAVYDLRTLARADRDGALIRRVDKVAQERRIPTDQVVQEINSRWQSYTSTSQLVYPLFVALALKLFLGRRRLYFAEHLIFALHVLAFMFLSFVAVWPLLLVFGMQISLQQMSTAFLVISVASFVWLTVYLVLAMRRAYGEPWFGAILNGCLVFLTYMVTSVCFTFVTLALALHITRRGGWFG